MFCLFRLCKYIIVFFIIILYVLDMFMFIWRWSWWWSYSSSIDIYLWNQRISTTNAMSSNSPQAKCIPYNIMWSRLSVTHDRYLSPYTINAQNNFFFSNFIIWLNYYFFLIYPVFQYTMKPKQWILQYFNLQYILYSIKSVCIIEYPGLINFHCII